MKTLRLLISLLLLAPQVYPGQKVAPPKPVSPTPSAAQVAWQQMEYYAFAHFNMNTFTDHEWGEGRAHPDVFNPTELDPRQWAKVVKDSGARLD